MKTTLVAGLGLLIALCASGPLCAQSTDGAGVGEGDQPQRSLAVELKFAGDAVQLVGTRPSEAFVPQQFGTPQLEPLFFEVYGDGGEVLYAATLGDPRDVHEEKSAESTAEESPAPAPAAHDTAEVVVPDLPAAREIAVFKRASKDSEERQQLMRAPLGAGR